VGAVQGKSSHDSGIDRCHLPEPCFGLHCDSLSNNKVTSNFFQNVHKSQVKCNQKDDPQWRANYKTRTGCLFWIDDNEKKKPETTQKNQFKATKATTWI